MGEIIWIDALSDEAIAYAAQKWGLATYFARQVLEKAIKDESISPRLPLEEFHEYVELLTPRQQPFHSGPSLHDIQEYERKHGRPKFFENCPVCNAETPPGVHNCPRCGVNLEIARSKANESLDKIRQDIPKPKPKITFGIVLGYVFGCFIFLLIYGIIKDTISADLAIAFAVVVPVALIIGKVFKPKTRFERRMLGLLALGVVAFIFIQGEKLFSAITADPSPTSTPTPRYIPTYTHIPQTPTPEINCLFWSEVTPQMAGNQSCVYGTVSNYRESYSIGQSFIYFGTEDQFFFTSELKWDKSPKGHCVQAFGTIQLNTYRVPYILIDELYTCD